MKLYKTPIQSDRQISFESRQKIRVLALLWISVNLVKLTRTITKWKWKRKKQANKQRNQTKQLNK